MTRVRIYTKDDCIWCDRAKFLLKQFDLHYDELKLDEDYTKEDLRLLIGEEKRLIVPQIFIDNRLIGSYNDLTMYLEDHNVMGTQQ